MTGLVATLGAEGALAIVEDGKPIQIKPQSETEVVDAIGTGDAFASMLILGLRLNWPLAMTLERSQCFASELVRRRGATTAERALYWAYCEKWIEH